MTTVTLKEAQATLESLVHGLRPGEEIVIFEDDHPIARVTLPVTDSAILNTRKLGFLPGSVKAISADFDAPLEDMRDYMQ